MMTPSVVTLQEVLRHHRTLSRRGREFYESLLAHGDVLRFASTTCRAR